MAGRKCIGLSLECKEKPGRLSNFVGMEFIDPALLQYAEAHSADEPEVLKKLSRETYLKIMQPRMLSGHLQGRFLSMISKLHRPKLILEIGTYTGYSALCLAEGLQPGGLLHTIDNNPEREAFVNGFFREAGMTHCIQAHIAEAQTKIPEIPGSFDLVFIDADKANYSLYYDLVIDRMPPGGLILADNVLWSGKVIQAVKESDVDTVALMEFNRKVKMDPRVECLLLPLRDGISMLRKR